MTPDRPAGETASREFGATAVQSPDIPAALRDHPTLKVERLLGRGGMGEVYLARHALLDKPVAVKVMAAALVADEKSVARFHAEIRAVAKLDHANIVRALDAQAAGGLHLFVMEYVAGQPLDEVVAARGPLPVAAACRCARMAALGLQHAHENGLAHRDLKPANLILSKAGQVKILDFGLAKLTGERAGRGLTTQGVAIGTPDFIAPEQARDTASADIRADIYALGGTLLFLLTGRPPFSGASAVDVMMKHVGEPPPRATDLRPDVPPALADLIARMLAKDPAARPQTPKAVADALVPFARKADAAPTPPPARRRWPWAAGAAGVAALAAVAFLAARRGDDAAPVATPPVEATPARPVGPLTVLSVWRDGERRGIALDAAGWKVENRELVCSSDDGHNNHLTFGDPAWTDYDFSVEARQDGPVVPVRLMVRWRSRSDAVTCVFSAQGQGPRVFGHSAGKSATPVEEPQKVALTAGTWHKLLVRVRGSKGTLLVDDKPVGTFAVDGHPRGMVGVSAFAKAIRFRRFQVTAPDERPLWQGLPRLDAPPPAEVNGVRQMAGPWGDVTALAFLPDGRLLSGSRDDRAESNGEAVGGPGTALCLWDATTGKLLKASQPPASAADNVGFEGVAATPGGRLVLTCRLGRRGVGREGVGVELWSAAALEPLRPMPPGPADAFAVGFTADGRALVGEKTGGAVWAWGTGAAKPERLVAGPADVKATAMAFSADGRWAAVGWTGAANAGQLRRIDLAARSAGPAWAAHDAAVRAVAFGPDGTLTSGGADNVAAAWDAAGAAQRVRFVGHERSVNGVAVSPDGTRVATASADGTARVWDAATGRETHRLEGAVGLVHCVAFSPDGRHLATGGSDQVVRLWPLD